MIVADPDDFSLAARTISRKIIAFAAAVTVAIFLAVVVIPANKAAAQPALEVCTHQGSKSLCLNRQGAGTNPGTFVIAYNGNDPNNDFGFQLLQGMCAAGYVSAHLECPFTKAGASDLNYKYDGSAIVQILNIKTGLCVADSGSGLGTTVLGTCNDYKGSGGSYGTIFTLSQVTDFLTPLPTTYAVNRYWSDLPPGQGGGGGTKARWLCLVAYRAPFLENFSSASAGTCQFDLK